MRPTDDAITSIIAPLYALSTGMSRVVSSKPQVGRLAVLQVVAHAPRIHPSRIATALKMHQSQVTRLVQALEDENLITVTADPADRRSYLVTLTDAGTAEITRLTAIGMARWRQFLADWDEGEVVELGRLLAKLQSSITAVNQSSTSNPEARRTRRRRP
jgi:DNA-binding MarR family transcriptional regulator